MIKLELSLNEINTILTSIQKGSWDEVNDLIIKIRSQAISQLEEQKEENKA